MPLKVLDLFAGCGGLSQGLSDAGFVITAACEKDRWAAETYGYNHPNVELIISDLQDIDEGRWTSLRGSIDVVAGGPPCQGFSISGKRQYGIHSQTNSMVKEFARIVRLIDPPFVLIENVEGFRTAEIRPGLRARNFIIEKLSAAGYELHEAVLQASDFGVPSLRRRYFLIGSKNPLAISPFPRPSHGLPGRLPHVTVAEAIFDLPPIQACEGSERAQVYSSSPLSSFQAEMRRNSSAVYNHVAMKHSPRLIERFATIPPGGSSYRLSEKKGETKITVYKSNNQRLRADVPSLCITANFQSNYIHPILNRNLTAREAARLMSFPDSFLFKGKRTQMSSSFLKKYDREYENHLSQYNQIGNAVPPLLAKAIGEAILQALYGGGAKTERQLALNWKAA